MNVKKVVMNNKELDAWKIAIKEDKCNYCRKQKACLLYRPEIMTSQGQKVAEKKVICLACIQMAFANWSSHQDLKKGSEQWENMNEDGSMGSCVLPNQKEKEILMLQINTLLNGMPESERKASLDYIKKTIPCGHCVQRILDKWKLNN